MAQDPIQVDAIQIAPSEAGTRILDEDGGSLRIQDPGLSAATKLVDLSGLRSVDQVLVVGKSGPGATYTTIQEAVDAVPSTATIADPWVILVMPGVYQENLLIEKDGVFLYGFGAVLKPLVADATVLIQGGVGSTPEYCRLQNLRIENSEDGEECVKVVGGAGSTVGLHGVTIENCELVASGVGTMQVYAEAVDKVSVNGGSFWGSSATSLIRVTQLHRFALTQVEEVELVQVDYDTGGAVPSLFGSSYVFAGLSTGNLQCTLQGGGSLEVADSTCGNVVLFGDQPVVLRGSKVGELTCNNTSTATLISTSRGAAAGAGTLVESVSFGSVVFAASASQSVSFDVKTLDVSYGVSLDYEIASLANVKTKTVSGFVVEFTGPQTGSVDWTVHRRV